MILTIHREHNFLLSDDLVLNENFEKFLKQGNIVKRLAFNYFKKNPKAKISDCEKYIKGLNNLNMINASWIKSLCNMMKNIDKDNDNQVVKKGKLFGKRKLFYELSKNDFKTNIDREKTKLEFLNSKNNQLLLMRGSTSDSNGNRVAKLSIDNGDSNILNIELNLNKHVYKMSISNIERNQMDDIKRLVELLNEKKTYFNIGISGEEIYISYDNSLLKEKQSDLIYGRVLSLDLNPGEVGVVVMDNNTIYEERVFYFKDLIKIIKADKMDNEMSILGKMIVNLASHYKCERVVLEKLKFKQGNGFRMLNEWNRKDLTESINKWCDYLGIKYIEVIATYSSFIGQYKYPHKIDSIAAAIELGKRGYLTSVEIIERYKSLLNVKISYENLTNRWKEELTRIKMSKFDNISLLDLYAKFKKSSQGYNRVRIRLNQNLDILVGHSLKSKKSLVTLFDTKAYHFI